MSRIVFSLYYSGVLALIVSYNMHLIWIDRLAVIVIIFSCWLHAKLWLSKIQTIHQSPSSIANAYELMKHKRNESDIFFRLLPAMFLSRKTEAREYLFNKESNKTISTALMAHFDKNGWDLIVLPAIVALLIWVYGIRSFHYDRFYKINPHLHEVMIHFTIFVFSSAASLLLVVFFINLSLRSSK